MIVVLVGPIKFWWDENWNTAQHREYAAHREEISEALVAAGHLVYRPHEAFKGAWDERGQAVNDTAIQMADVIVHLGHPSTPSEGSEKEIHHAGQHGKPIFRCPPGTSPEALLGSMSSLV